MKPSHKHLLKAAWAVLFGLLIGFQTMPAQSGKKQKAHAEEILKAEAYAYAYITCKYELKKYESKIDKDNRKLQTELKNIEALYNRFNLRANIKFKRDPEVYPKFNRFVKTAWKELTLCEEYTDIQKALEESGQQIR
jgi:hypothetical protein